MVYNFPYKQDLNMPKPLIDPLAAHWNVIPQGLYYIKVKAFIHEGITCFLVKEVQDQT